MYHTDVSRTVKHRMNCFGLKTQHMLSVGWIVSIVGLICISVVEGFGIRLAVIRSTKWIGSCGSVPLPVAPIPSIRVGACTGGRHCC